MTESPEPRANAGLLGHEAAEAALVEAVTAGRLHHAWLLTGPPGIGKATLAFRFGRRLLAGGAFDTLELPQSHPTFRRVAAGTHADLLTIERGFNEKTKKPRTEIVVDDVRDVTGFMHLTPAEGGWRVVVVDGAEFLNRSAANALLKVLEEPPPRAVLLLVCSAVGRLLPTIRSRCRMLRLGNLSEAVVAELLARSRPEIGQGERIRLAALSDGSIGRALRLADEGGLAIAELARRSVARFERLTTADAVAAHDSLGRDEEAFGTLMDMLREGISGRVREAARRGATDVAGRPLADLSAAWSTLARLKSVTEGVHLDKREALVQGFAVLAGRAPPDIV